MLFFTAPVKPTIEVPKEGKVISVSSPSPVIIDVGDNITTLTNSTIKIKCPSSGVPKPQVVWIRDGAELASGGRFVIDNDGTLTVTWVQDEDSGQFSCHAHNKFGKDNKKSSVSVVGKFDKDVCF